MRFVESLRKYRVWSPSRDEEQGDAREIAAFDAQVAAADWAERDDCESADYTIVGGTPADVVVIDVETGERTEWTVEGESIPHYTARRRA